MIGPRVDTSVFEGEAPIAGGHSFGEFAVVTPTVEEGHLGEEKGKEEHCIEDTNKYTFKTTPITM